LESNEDMGSNNQLKSQSSINSENSGIDTRDGKELLENWANIAIRMSNVWISVFMNLSLVWVLLSMASRNGMEIPSPHWFHEPIRVYILVWILISYLFTSAAMNNGAGVLIGYLLSRPSGFSLSACYFERSNWYEKMRFSSRLSVRSKAKKMISRLSIGWGLHALVLFPALLAPVTIRIEDQREKGGYVACVEYSQVGNLVN
jgi:hypothetical protein